MMPFARAATLGILFTSALAQAGAREELKAYSEPLLRTLSREVIVYHWAKRKGIVGNDSNPVAPMHDKRVLQYVDQTISKAWDPVKAPPEDTITMGDGFYVAMDPAAVRTIGRDDETNEMGDFALLQLALPEGMKFLASLRGKDAATKAIIQTIVAAGCGPTEVAFAHEEEPLRLIFEEAYSDAECRKLRDDLIEDLGAWGVLYPYLSTSYSFCPQRKEGYASMVIFDHRAFQKDRLVAFTRKLPKNGDAHSENRLMIQKLLTLADIADAEKLSELFESPPEPDFKKEPWLELADQEPKTDVVKWAQRRLMGCGSFEEDAF